MLLSDAAESALFSMKMLSQLNDGQKRQQHDVSFEGEQSRLPQEHK